jgi:polyisoprenoid-binding protein YceI
MRYLIALIFISLYSFTKAQVYVPIGATSNVSFKIKNFGSTVDGTIKGLKGTLSFNPSTLSDAVFDVTIDAATIDTGVGLRDKHLRKPDYFDVANYPTIRFVSTKVVPAGKPNEAVITGKLTIKKTTKEVTFNFRYAESKNALRFTGEFQLDRRDFEVGGNSISLSDKLRVLLDVNFSK